MNPLIVVALLLSLSSGVGSQPAPPVPGCQVTCSQPAPQIGPVKPHHGRERR